jgi:hypothetical protein
MDLDQRGGVGQLWCELADQTEDEPVELADRSRIGRLHRCSVVGGEAFVGWCRPRPSKPWDAW